MMSSNDKTASLSVREREDSENFGQRWSRRKLETRGDREDEVAKVPHTAAGSGEVAPEAESDPPALTDADMPPIESLDAHSDYSAFLSPKVSEGLRRKALRKLFGLPQFQGSDGLNDYDEDYRRFAALGDIITHEMRDMLEREMRRAEGAAGLDEQQAPPVVTAAASTEDEAGPDSEGGESDRTPVPDTPREG